MNKCGLFKHRCVEIDSFLCFRCEGGVRASSVGDAGSVSGLPASALQEGLVLLLQTAGQTGHLPVHPVGLHQAPEPR